jgi:adenylyltransferase/sulfurtransferase
MVEWFDQDYVRGLDVVVVGAGAVGNEVAKNLCLLGVGALHLVDLDRVEPHNLPKAVLFREADVGRGKAEVAAARCAELDPNVAVTHADGDFWDALDLERLRRAAAVVCCVDSIEARLRLSGLCQLAGVPPSTPRSTAAASSSSITLRRGAQVRLFRCTSSPRLAQAQPIPAGGSARA